MSVWDLYDKQSEVRGSNKREAVLAREERMLTRKLKDSLSYHKVLIDGVEQKVAIINSDNLNEKSIFSLPKEDITLGGLVSWMDNKWLVTERDANTEVYTKAKMIQCNHLLKWIDSNGVIQQQWCVIEDGTKYLTGELEDRNFVVTRGDSRIAMTIARNEKTLLFDRTTRFLIDDPLTRHKLAYALTKPLHVGWTYNDHGVFSFVLQEVTATDDDNHELGIADYYKYHPKDVTNLPDSDTVINPENKNDVGREVWL